MLSLIAGVIASAYVVLFIVVLVYFAVIGERHREHFPEQETEDETT